MRNGKARRARKKGLMRNKTAEKGGVGVSSSPVKREVRVLLHQGNSTVARPPGVLLASESSSKALSGLKQMFSLHRSAPIPQSSAKPCSEAVRHCRQEAAIPPETWLMSWCCSLQLLAPGSTGLSTTPGFTLRERLLPPKAVCHMLPIHCFCLFHSA